MKKLPLSEKELEILKSNIKEIRIRRNEFIKKNSLSTFFGFTLAGILLYLNKDFEISSLILALIGVYLFFIFLLISLSYLMIVGLIKKEETDININLKIVSESKIKSINRLNGKIKLEDNSYVFQPINSEEIWKKGDLIKYTITLSNNYQFECKKVEN